MDEPQFSLKDNGLTTVYKNTYGLTTSNIFTMAKFAIQLVAFHSHH